MCVRERYKDRETDTERKEKIETDRKRRKRRKRERETLITWEVVRVLVVVVDVVGGGRAVGGGRIGPGLGRLLT